MNERTIHILTELGKQLESGGTVDGFFVKNHKITADELSVLEVAGCILKGVAKLHPDVILSMAMRGDGMPESVISNFLASRQLPRTAEKVLSLMNKIG